MSVTRDSGDSQNRTCVDFRAAIRELAFDPAKPNTEELATHLRECEACRAYQAAEQKSLGALRKLSEEPVVASPDFRRRWQSAVMQEQPQPSPNASQLLPFSLQELISWLTGLLRANQKPVAALAVTWLLIFYFRTTVPDSHPVQTGDTSWTPASVARFLSAENAFYLTETDFNSSQRL